MASELLYKVPEHLAAALDSGAVERVGALLVNSSSRQIVAHMQEAGGIRNVLSAGSAVLGGVPLNPLSVSTGAVTIAQNEQIKSALSTLQMLQMGTMVLSGVNLGVSIVGFAVVTHKINGLKKQLSSVEEKLDQIAARIEDLHHDQIANDFDALQVECQRVDEAFMLGDPVAQWASAAGALHHLEKRFHRRAQLLIEGSVADLMLVETFVEAFTLASSTRTTARLASNDVEAARQSSITMSQTLAQLTGQFGAPDFLSEKLRGQELSPVKIRQEISNYRTEAETRAARLRDREEIAATTPLTLNQLRIEEISGRQWLEDLRSEETEPVALLIPLESK